MRSFLDLHKDAKAGKIVQIAEDKQATTAIWAAGSLATAAWGSEVHLASICREGYEHYTVEFSAALYRTLTADEEDRVLSRKGFSRRAEAKAFIDRVTQRAGYTVLKPEQARAQIALESLRRNGNKTR